MSVTDDRLMAAVAALTDYTGRQDVQSEGQLMLIAGTINDPDSFNSTGGKTGALGYYPVADASGVVRYQPSVARIKADADAAAVGKAPIASPVLTGAPKTPTPAVDASGKEILSAEYLRTPYDETFRVSRAMGAAGIRSAMTAAKGRGAFSTKIYIEPGAYIVGGADFPDMVGSYNVAIDGGGESTVLIFDQANSGRVLRSSGTAGNLSIENLRVAYNPGVVLTHPMIDLTNVGAVRFGNIRTTGAAAIARFINCANINFGDMVGTDWRTDRGLIAFDVQGSQEVYGTGFLLNGVIPGIAATRAFRLKGLPGLILDTVRINGFECFTNGTLAVGGEVDWTEGPIANIWLYDFDLDSTAGTAMQFHADSGANSLRNVSVVDLMASNNSGRVIDLVCNSSHVQDPIVFTGGNFCYRDAEAIRTATNNPVGCKGVSLIGVKLANAPSGGPVIPAAIRAGTHVSATGCSLVSNQENQTAGNPLNVNINYAITPTDPGATITFVGNHVEALIGLSDADPAPGKRVFEGNTYGLDPSNDRMYANRIDGALASDRARSLLTKTGAATLPYTTADAAFPGVPAVFARSDGFSLTPVTFAAQWDFTRASSATDRNAAGALVTAAAGAARLGYRWSTTSSSWVLAGLLLEQQASNNLQWSNDFTQAAWAKSSATIPAAGALIETSASAIAHYISQSPTFVSGAAYTLSVIASERGGSAKRYLMLYFSSSSHGMTIVAYFDLATGLVSNLTAGAAISAGARSIGGGKWLCWLTATATASVAGQTMIRLADTRGGFSYTGDGTSGLNIEHAQVEVGDAPTSRIVTSAALATRLTDSMTKALSTDWNPAAMTALFRYRASASVKANAFLYRWSNAANSHAIECYIDANKRFQFRVFVGGAQTAVVSGPVMAIDTDYAIAIAFDVATNRIRAMVNRVAYAEATPTAWPVGLTVRELAAPNGYIMPYLANATRSLADATELTRALSFEEMARYM